MTSTRPTQATEATQATQATRDHRASWPAQVTYPGQTFTAPGPHDMSHMYLAHHAFRRDLARFESAVRRTPVGEATVWAALQQRWETFATVLHHHHTIEDVTIWPVVTTRADPAGIEVLEAMEAEHELIDPLLAACGEGFAAMVTHPCDDHRNALDVHVTSARQLLGDHLRHEETDAIPLIQALMTDEEFAAMEAFAGEGISLGQVVRFVPWVLHDLPPAARAEAVAASPAAFRLIDRLFTRRFRRGERVAFRYA
jgi:hypothetical protein